MAHVPPFTPDPRLFPFQSRWFESGVGPVHYIDEGGGDPILFLHGNPTWSFLYRGIVIRLKPKFRCIALDYPGFGLSVRPDGYGYTPSEHASVVRDLVRHLDLEGLTIMGQDWGGPIGLRVAVDEVDRLRSLVMGNTWYWPLDDWQAKAFSYVLSMAPMQSQIVNKNFFVERIMPIGVKHTLADEVMEHYREALPTPSSRVGAAEFPRQLMEASAWLGDLEDAVRERLSNVPLLLTWGVHDIAFGKQYLERFREDFHMATVRRLDAKHYIQEDAPGEIAAAISSFLEAGQSKRSSAT
ncbi:MAG: alpha/beta fold hydrolase [Gemmatimonadota bacterium]|nr:alpha/beta fold hydrolase [Gemmatimonadota bacterium]MDH3422012.1 alpha/beta fold hydrolase [Gemmatimonadota bacterium]